MKNKEAKKLLKEVFDSIKKSKTIDDLEKTMEKIKNKIPPKNIISENKYPKIDFEISKEEMDKINLKDDFTFAEDILSQIKTPLEKLFYAVAWKRGDLIKYKHVIKGIKEANLKNTSPNKALTFYQFGKYLSDRKTQPIIDQHVIRSYKLHNYKGNDTTEILKIRKLNTLTSKHKGDISNYKNWIGKLSIGFPKEMREEVLFKIDRILMALGKAIKTK